jgi:flagellar biosynthesis regulator FlaF
VAYNNPTPDQSTTLSAEERSREAERILNLLRAERLSALEEKLTASALDFVRKFWHEQNLWDKVVVSPNQLLWLRDIWSKLA